MLVPHVYEEEKYPGGFGYMFNVVRGEANRTASAKSAKTRVVNPSLHGH